MFRAKPVLIPKHVRRNFDLSYKSSERSRMSVCLNWRSYLFWQDISQCLERYAVSCLNGPHRLRLRIFRISEHEWKIAPENLTNFSIYPLFRLNRAIKARKNYRLYFDSALVTPSPNHLCRKLLVVSHYACHAVTDNCLLQHRRSMHFTID